ncbi:class F sortase [Curtobacterium sp. MCBD17_019]|nr:class F sortase [Curtobacterium sp. MCBD17_019]
MGRARRDDAHLRRPRRLRDELGRCVVIRLPRWMWVTGAAALVVVGGSAGVATAVAAGREAPSATGTSAAAGAHAAGASGAPRSSGAGAHAGGANSSGSSRSSGGGGTNAAPGLQDPTANRAPTTAADATPTRVEVPSIGVDASLEHLHKDASGALQPPTQWMDAGWFSDGVVPGHTGPAVIAGHVDSITSAAVFFKLDELAPGDDIAVGMSDGTTIHFTVTGTERAPKTAFPTNDVYGPTPTPELRLITCDGAFDRATGHYVDNLIVFADLAND